MATFVRFSDAFLVRIRNEVDLADLVGRDLVLKRSGKNAVACCPFHEEKSPSFTVTPQKNSYYCYGCGAKGDAIDWMRNRHHMSFPDAVAYLAGVCGLPLPAPEMNGTDDWALRRRLAGLYQALKDASRLFVRGLEKSPAARSYLCDRRGLALDTIERFELGTVAKGVVEVMARGTAREALLESGLAIERDGKLADRFHHRIMFPIRNESGTLVGFAGRSMIEKPERTPKYLNCPETEIFHKGRELYGLHLAKPAIRAANTAVLVEGYFDVISLHQAGDTRTVAPMGTALTSQQARRLLVHADTVIFGFDGDAAGRRAALAAAAVMLGELKDGKSCKFIFLADGDDPDTFVRKHGLALWLQETELAMPLSAVLVQFVTHGLDRTLPESQVSAAGRARAVLERIQHAELFQRALRSKFEEVIGVSLY